MKKIYERLVGIVAILIIAGFIYALTNKVFGLDVSYVESIGSIFIAGMLWVIVDDILNYTSLTKSDS